jgi:hypothetical protein
LGQIPERPSPRKGGRKCGNFAVIFAERPTSLPDKVEPVEDPQDRKIVQASRKLFVMNM